MSKFYFWGKLSVEGVLDDIVCWCFYWVGGGGR